MPILFTCPHCGLQSNVGDEYAGQSGPCARCGRMITIPGRAGGFEEYGVPRRRKSRSGTPTIVVILVAVLGVTFVCGGILVALLLPAVQAAREAARRARCDDNLRQIALAFHNYHDVYKCLPPAVITDKNGKPTRSWRVAILPFIEQRPLFDRYNMNEPWDSQGNRALASTMPPIFHCPSAVNAKPTETNYVMITGPGTIGGKPNEIISFGDIKDGTVNTILVVEVVGSGIDWMEPRDLSLEQLSFRINDKSGKGISSKHVGGAMVVRADGSARFLSESLDPETLRRMILRDDGGAVPSF